MTFGEKFKKFWKEHWKEVAFVGGGLAVAGFACYKAYKSGGEGTDEIGEIPEAACKSIEDGTAWNKDWDEMAVQFELLTHQPLGSFANGYTEEEGYVDPLEGNCFIIAGTNSYYNDNPNQLDFYVLDNDGWYHRMPDELRT